MRLPRREVAGRNRRRRWFRRIVAHSNVLKRTAAPHVGQAFQPDGIRLESLTYGCSGIEKMLVYQPVAGVGSELVEKEVIP
jgi:hypothetical protein